MKQLQDMSVVFGLSTGVAAACLRVNNGVNMDFPEIRLMTDTIVDLSSLDGVHVGHAREVLEQQLAEVQQHATAKEEELKKAKEAASITESAAMSREEEQMKTMAELTDAKDSYSRCRADLDYAANQGPQGGSGRCSQGGQ